MPANIEWLETDGLGGFASGMVEGPPTRRYHAILLAARTPPARRVVLVNGFEAWVQSPAGRWPLNTHRYVPDVTAPTGMPRLLSFNTDPWPTWVYQLPNGLECVYELVVRHDAPITALSWRLTTPRPDVTLVVRPFLTGRDLHALHHENSAFEFDAHTSPGRVLWRPYQALPAVVARHNGTYAHDPQWYRQVQYDEDRTRGYDFVEDLAAPGILRWDISSQPAILVLGADLPDARLGLSDATTAVPALDQIRRSERQRRRRFHSPIERAADAFIVQRGQGESIIAGYPWFGDWGRDTFVAVRGLCVATNRLESARHILLEWSTHLSEGMMPNQFPGDDEAPTFNSVDAALWFIIAAHDLLTAAANRPRAMSARARGAIVSAIHEILDAYHRGTRYRIHTNADGLLAAGEPGIQLTWMDAKYGNQIVTPRVGKPVEVQALWINALRIGAGFDAKWEPLLDRAWAAFRERFWRPHDGCCYDVVDVDHQPGRVDATFRPNQIFAVGGLPYPLLNQSEGRQLVDAVEERLWTPMGLRTLAPDEPGYVGHYEGNTETRDTAYHQGTVWPWLIGPFVEAWIRVRGNTPIVRRQAQEQFVAPLWRTLGDHTMPGHVPEIADGDPPHTPRGCPFQAWSVSELLRLEKTVLAVA